MRRNWITKSTDSKADRGEAATIKRTCFEGKASCFLSTEIHHLSISYLTFFFLLYSTCHLKVSLSEIRILKREESYRQQIQPYICHSLLLIQTKKLTLTATYRMISMCNTLLPLKLDYNLYAALFLGANICSSSMTSLKCKMTSRYWNGWDCCLVNFY